MTLTGGCCYFKAGGAGLAAHRAKEADRGWGCIPAAYAAGGFSAYAACRRPNIFQKIVKLSNFNRFGAISADRGVILVTVSLIFVNFNVFGRFFVDFRRF